MRRRRWWVAGAALVLLVVAASAFASGSPDGLESVAADLGFAASATDAPFELFTDYTVSGLEGPASTALAGILGVGVVLAGVWFLGRGLARRRDDSRPDA